MRSEPAHDVKPLDTIALTQPGEVVWETRPGAQSNGGGIAWAVRSSGNTLMSGFGRLTSGSTPAKTLDHDEVIHVLSGVLGIRSEGTDTVAHAGGVLAISQGATVTYFGEQAEFFFVITAG